MSRLAAKHSVGHVIVGREKSTGAEYILENVAHNETPEARLAAYRKWPNLAGIKCSEIFVAMVETTTVYTRVTA